MSKRLFPLVTALAFACSSCGSSNKLYNVSGRVMYKGAPAAGATVFFQRQGADPLHEQNIMGIVQPDGSFNLVCGPHGEGAPPGDYDVLIEWRERTGAGKGLAEKGSDRLKGRYADPKHPLLRAVVKAKPNSLPTFELTD